LAKSSRPETDPTDDVPRSDKPVAPDVSIAQEHVPLETAVLDPETASALQNPSTGRNVARATASIGVLHVLRLVIGFVAQPLIANRFGLRWQADVYAVATDIVTSLFLIFEKVVNPTFLPCFVRALNEEGEERAWRFTSTALWLTIIALCIVTPLAWWGMPWIVDIYSQKAGAEQREMTVAIARLLLSGLFFLGISALTYVILNGYKRFTSAALGDTLWKLGVGGAAGLAVGLNLSPNQSLYFFAWGFIIGSVLKLVPHVIALRAKWNLLRPKIDWHDPLVHKMMWLAVPLFLGIVISESRDIYRNWLADSPLIPDVEAGRAALRFSRLIGTSLIQVFPYALSIGIFPYLADLARDRDRQPFTDTIVSALRVCIFTFGPITAILIALRFPLLRAVWESGNMTQQDTIVMSAPFVAFTLGLVGFSCEMMLNQTFYAMTNAWTPTIIGVGTSILWVVIATMGVNAGWGLVAIAGAEAVAKSVKCVIMWFMLRPHLGTVRLRDNLMFCFKVAVGSLFAAAVAWAVVNGLAPTGEINSKVEKIKILLAVTAAGLSGVLFYIVLGAAAGVEEVRSVIGFVGKLKKRLARG